VERAQDHVMLQDVQEAPAASFDVEEGEATSSTAASETPGESAAAASDNTQAIPSAEPQTGPGARAPSAAPAGGTAAAAAPDLPCTAAEAIMVLFVFQSKMRQDQIKDADTVEELTNGVSSRRNQLLMDMSAEIGVPAIDGAADADVATLRERVKTAAPGYSPFGTVLSEAITARLRQLTGAAGVKPAYISERVTGTWGLPMSWAAHVEAEILLGSREEDS